MSLQFTRNIENFSCGHCGHEVIGDGYTNHCPHCLWSQHVDINPGDRLEPCRGLMEPESIEMLRGKYEIIHRCTRCGAIKRNKARPEDQIGDFLANLIQ